jgi:ribose transport system ATP-binding protein
MYQESKKYLKMIGINLDPKLKVSELSIAKQQMVEIAKVLSLGAKIIILDEPTDTLSNIEANQLFKVLEKLKKKKIAILYVTHRMKEIKKICERYTILKDGLFIKSGFVKDISINKIIENMIGRKIEEQFPKQKFKKDKCVMEIKNLSSEILFNVNLKIYNGEILGIAGLVGSKRTEFAKTIVGLMNYNFGKIFYKNKILKKIKTKKMIENGIYYVTENRKKDGLFLNLDVSHNVIISNINKVLNKMKIISTKKIKNSTHLARKKLNIKFNNIDDKPLSLSGGNQQKLLLAKALFTNPQILILDEPTRGVDVGSRKEIYNIINDFATQGKAVVVISSELPEIIGISNRVAVFNNGYLRGILNKKEISEKEIMNLAILEN